MINFIKYLPLVALGKDVSKAYEEEHGKDRPFFLSRRFYGAVIVFIGVGLSIHFKVDISMDQLTQITNGVGSVMENAEKLIASCSSLYGAVILIVGIVNRKKTGDKI